MLEIWQYGHYSIMRDAQNKRLEYITDLVLNVGIIKGELNAGVSLDDPNIQVLAADVNVQFDDYTKLFGEDSVSIQMEEELIELGLLMEMA